LNATVKDSPSWPALMRRGPKQVPFAKCLVPCDHVPTRSWPLFRAREIMPALIESFKQGKKP
jgi:hypothetical protein